MTSTSVPLKAAFWDYLIWGDAAFTVIEFAIRRFGHFLFVVPGVGYILTVCHLIYLLLAFRLVLVNRTNCGVALVRWLAIPALLVYAVMCLGIFASYGNVSPVSYATLHFINAALRLVHG